MNDLEELLIKCTAAHIMLDTVENHILRGAETFLKETVCNTLLTPPTATDPSAGAVLNCGVCLENITYANTKTLPCGHGFCTDCLKKWLVQKNQCPLCRRDDVVPELAVYTAAVDQLHQCFNVLHEGFQTLVVDVVMRRLHNDISYPNV